jgi:hypothetical protein
MVATNDIQMIQWMEGLHLFWTSFQWTAVVAGGELLVDLQAWAFPWSPLLTYRPESNIHPHLTRVSMQIGNFLLNYM